MATVVNGVDLSQYTWDQVAGEVHASKLQQAGASDGFDMYGGAGFSNILGLSVQGYVDTNYDRYVREKGYVRPDDFGVDANKYENLSNLNFKDANGPEGMMTSLYRNADGSIGVGYYKEEDNFLRDMVMFVASAYLMYTGLSLAGGEMGAAAAGAAETSGAGAAGSSAAGVGEAAAAAETGFQATQLAAPWEPVASGSLGSGTYGLEAVEGLLQVGTTTSEGFSVGGMTLTGSGDVIAAGSSFSATQGASALPWSNAASSTITDIAAAGGTTVSTAASPFDIAQNWWESLPSLAKDVGKGLLTGAISDSAIGTPSLDSSVATVKVPGSMLSAASNQRAGVKFGRPKSKRQLKGKFSGTGISLK